MNPFTDNQVWKNLSKQVWIQEKNRDDWDEEFRKDVNVSFFLNK